MDQMHTDARGLMDAGLDLAEAAWKTGDFDWSDCDRFIIHQVSRVHTSALCERLGIDQKKVPLSFPFFGNIGPASVPFTLAHEVDNLYVVDGSFFPSSGAVNPALTIMANALRVGDHLLERL